MSNVTTEELYAEVVIATMEYDNEKSTATIALIGRIDENTFKILPKDTTTGINLGRIVAIVDVNALMGRTQLDYVNDIDLEMGITVDYENETATIMSKDALAALTNA
jgi:hypothetical protein